MPHGTRTRPDTMWCATIIYMKSTPTPNSPIWTNRVCLFAAKATCRHSKALMLNLSRKPDGWYLSLVIDEKWKNAEKRTLVKTSTLEKVQIPNQAFTNPDGSPLKIGYDYLGTKRKGSNPYPGPFEAKRSGTTEWKVWQKK